MLLLLETMPKSTVADIMRMGLSMRIGDASGTSAWSFSESTMVEVGWV